MVGYLISLQSKNKDWQKALHQAINHCFSEGIKDSQKNMLYLVSDNGCQPTSFYYMKACSDLDIKQITICWSNPKGNADTERVIRTLKEDLVWPYNWEHPFHFQRALTKWVNNYNHDFPHQALNYQALKRENTNLKCMLLMGSITSSLLNTVYIIKKIHKNSFNLNIINSFFYSF